MFNQIEVSEYKSPLGELIIGTFNDQICLCDWKYRKMRKSIDERIKKALASQFEMKSSELAKKCIMQLESYFHDELKEFNLPLKMLGSEFQQLVWDNLMEIPYGKTESYAGLSEKIGNPEAIRAVATANGANALAIIIPCHRVIGSDGSLTGYAGGLTAKKKLLQLEGSYPEQLTLF